MGCLKQADSIQVHHKTVGGQANSKIVKITVATAHDSY